MKSICLKTNNDEIISYILRQLDEVDDIVVSSNQFKLYKNIIVHYVGENEKNFLIIISNIIGETIENFYEKRILDKIIEDNYCYFEEGEKEVILRISEKIIELQEASFKYKREILKGLVYEYFLDNRVMILDGFVNFRVRPYLEVLDYVVDTSVTNFVFGLQ